MVFFLFAFSQCDKCRTNLMEDLTQWELSWSDAKALSGASAMAIREAKRAAKEESRICHVSSKDKVYLLNPDGKSWQFTQAAEGGLTCEPVANFSETDVGGNASFFAFSAGPMEMSALHVGIVNGKDVILKKYEQNVWQEVWHGSLEVMRDKTPAESCACSVTSYKGEAQLHGLVILRPNDPSQGPVVLYYDTKNLRSSSTWEYKGRGTPNAVLEIAPSTLLVNEKGTVNSSAVFSWTQKHNSYKVVSGHISSLYPRASLFLLHTRDMVNQAVWVHCTNNDGKIKLQFYTVTHSCPYSLRHSGDLPKKLPEKERKESNEDSGNERKEDDPDVDYSEALILPFSEMVYVVVEDQSGRLLYQKGILREPVEPDARIGKSDT
eukprot:CAMPEP_0116831824 /NCGR_PEP_ID=MMETSP0418-20121206/5552_1 /TAXON_ID=1158023 /ORGANISM="Astrosyne radiata, Strain 13vi08-1A" /LENGTH=378 /DNA_ID=CAMNT_0004461119 /DNA_START=2768 /DNA_END=3904 /DNA_ORIENTATION=+